MTTRVEPPVRAASAPIVEPIYDATQLPNRRKWTRADFAGLDDNGARYELIQGELVEKME